MIILSEPEPGRSGLFVNIPHLGRHSLAFNWAFYCFKLSQTSECLLLYNIDTCETNLGLKLNKLFFEMDL